MKKKIVLIVLLSLCLTGCVPTTAGKPTPINISGTESSINSNTPVEGKTSENIIVKDSSSDVASTEVSKEIDITASDNSILENKINDISDKISDEK